MKNVVRVVTVLAIVVAAVAAPTTALAGTPWSPNRPIEIVVGFGPGGGVATVSELAAKIATETKLSPQPVFVTYKPGANALIAAALVSQRRGDPHSIHPAGGAIAVQKATGETPVDPLTDLTPLANNAMDYPVVVTSAKSKYRTLQDAIDQSKKSPKSVTVAGAGGGPSSWDGMTTIVLGLASGVEFNQIPFNSGAEVQAAVLGGQVDLGVRQLSNAMQLYESGQMRILASFAGERDPRIKDVPTLKELGINLEIAMARGWFGPPGLTTEQVAWYGELFRKIGESKTWQAYCEKNILVNRYLGPADFATFMGKQIGTITAIYKKFGVIK